jgi:hypothetical protein
MNYSNRIYLTDAQAENQRVRNKISAVNYPSAPYTGNVFLVPEKYERIAAG